MLCRILIFCGVVAAVACIKINDDRVDDLKKRLDDIKSQLREDEFEKRSEKLRQIVVKLSDGSVRNDFVDDFLCGTCRSVVSQFLDMRRVELLSVRKLKNLAQELCVDFEIQSEEVCHGIIEFNAPSIVFIIDNRPEVSSDTVCKLLLDVGNCLNPIKQEKLDFVVEIDNATISATTKAGDVTKEKLVDLTIVHISDVHVDLKYTVGAFSDCDEFACCREIDTSENDPESVAGVWGDYRSCDTPVIALENALRQIKKQHPQIDAIYFTGDVVDHFIWDTSVDGIKSGIDKTFNLMTVEFGKIPIFPILGNHDAQNIFTPACVNDTSLSVQWLYDHVAELWKGMLPPAALKTVTSGGYYTALVKPGLRMIALNNNVCYVMNWWLLYEVETIQMQFQWFHDVLLLAERAGEKVHILTHIPSGDEDFHKPCSREFNRIVDRFHGTISGQFHGHSEYFGFEIFHKDNEKTLPVNVAYSGGSIATFSGVNRNYVVYSVDPANYNVNDVESWTYNLTASNQKETRKPIWYRQFSLRQAFNLKDLLPSTLRNFATDLSKNMTAFQQLWQMRVRDSDFKLREGCSESCRKEIFCEMLITDNNDESKCQKILSGRR